ncbi:MAG: 2-C-methyl-D-erythritol 4-phosphate cytidylyltransferase [Hyphomicrobiaceae bacterium]|jgi:2-C-methyl-D-erythritol 4-phosphate cytidylyltransferase
MLPRLRTAIIIPAAGNGVRLGRDCPKALVPLDGRPLLSVTLERLAEAGSCDVAVITAPAASLQEISQAAAQARQSPAKIIQIVEGGSTRCASVFLALQALAAIDDSIDIVGVHDAARPLVHPRVVREVFEAASRVGAATVARRPVDSMREDTQHGVRSVERSRFWLVETPQAFQMELLVEAHRSALRDGFDATDDASLVERYGAEIALVESQEVNLKITRPEDLIVAEALIQSLSERR